MSKSWCETIIALIILVFAIWPGLVSFSNWIVIIAAAVLLVHSFYCKACFGMKGSAKKK